MDSDVTKSPLTQAAHNCWVGRDCLELLPGLMAEHGLGPRACAIITDSHVGPLYLDRAAAPLEQAGYRVTRHVFPAGESAKSMAQAGALCDELTLAAHDRKSVVVALGGGVCGDLAGFVAAIFFRGVPVVQVPTTIVSQVDSSVGGKTGVNGRHGKNLIGAFHQPTVVLADVALLDSLPRREFNEGFAEIIKHGCIRDRAMLEELAGFDRAELIARNIRIKADIVAQDPKELTGLRALLNFGHTIGHAIEAAAGYGELFHGEAISLGLRAALFLSRLKAGLSEADEALVLRLLAQFELPLQLSEALSTERIVSLMTADKKFEAGAIRFVLTGELGSAFVSKDVTLEDVKLAINELRQAPRL
jgi:3-dehydroquinate synthase